MVVGAGFTGLCTALCLAKAGVSVVLLEAGIIGCGASTLNGGMIGPSFHKLGIAGLKSKYGETVANNILRESLGFVDYLEDFLSVQGIEADFVRNGRFRGALKPSHYQYMARELEVLQKATGLKAEMITKSQQHLETGSNLFHGGVIYHRDAGLHPAKYHDGLVEKVKKAGVKIFANTALIGLKKIHSGYQLATKSGLVKVQQVAICTNGYTSAATPYLRRRIIPMRSAMIATESLGQTMMQILMPNKRVYSDSRRIIAYYRPSPDGKRILFGSRATGLKDKPLVNAMMLKKFMVAIFPQLCEVEISHVWSGLVAYTFDHAPHIGQYGGGEKQGVFYAMGYCGSGVARASYFGHKLGLKMLGSEECNTAFDDLVFTTKPFYDGRPWFMSTVLSWHRLLDKFNL